MPSPAKKIRIERKTPKEKKKPPSTSIPEEEKIPPSTSTPKEEKMPPSTSTPKKEKIPLSATPTRQQQIDAMIRETSVLTFEISQIACNGGSVANDDSGNAKRRKRYHEGKAVADQNDV